MDKRGNIRLVELPCGNEQQCARGYANAQPCSPGLHLATLVAATVCIVSLVLACCSFAAHAAAPQQTLDTALLCGFIAEQSAAALGVPVEVVERRALPELTLPAGKVELTLRFPHSTGQWLPNALEVRVDGRLLSALPLGPCIDFKLPVLVARDGLALGASVDGAALETTSLKLAPGQEVVTSTARLTGLQARGYFGPGMRLKLSRLVALPLVKRGMPVQLVLHAAGVQLSAQGTALADGYAGQTLSVRRESDGRIVRGVLKAGDPGAVVDVE